MSEFSESDRHQLLLHGVQRGVLELIDILARFVAAIDRGNELAEAWTPPGDGSGSSEVTDRVHSLDPAGRGSIHEYFRDSLFGHFEIARSAYSSLWQKYGEMKAYLPEVRDQFARAACESGHRVIEVGQVSESSPQAAAVRVAADIINYVEERAEIEWNALSERERDGFPYDPLGEFGGEGEARFAFDNWLKVFPNAPFPSVKEVDRLRPLCEQVFTFVSEVANPKAAIESQPEGGASANGGAEPNRKTSKRKKRRAGKPSGTTADRDEKMLKSWEAGGYSTHADLGLAFGGLKKDTVRKALERALIARDKPPSAE